MKFNNVAFVFSPATKELKIIINDETLIIPEFAKDTNNIFVRWLQKSEQLKVIKKLVNNLND